jgi:hypothetical protein
MIFLLPVLLGVCVDLFLNNLDIYMKQKHYFGHDHEILYDQVINHDVYAHLRIVLEVPRGQDTEALILLNHKPIGKVIAIRDGRGITVAYQSQRNSRDGFEDVRRSENLGNAVAAVVTSHV